MGNWPKSAVRLASVGVLALGGVLVGCGGQSKFLEDEEWTRDQPSDPGALREPESLFSEGESDVDRFNNDLNGVRLDLSMHPKAKPTARCSCLDVAVGRPGDQAFVWGQEVPMLSGDQMVVALRTEGALCAPGTRDEKTRRPSIRAVERRGDDVVVVIEELPLGRPLAHGVVTNQPKPGASLYLRPAHKGVSYGSSRTAKGRCRVFTRQHEGYRGTQR